MIVASPPHLHAVQVTSPRYDRQTIQKPNAMPYAAPQRQKMLDDVSAI
jgi:hypothetical protein